MDVVKLTKILALTTSNADGEALNAIRLANSMLMKEKMTWQDLMKVRLAGPEIREDAKTGGAKKPNRSERIKHMLEICLNHVHGQARDFIESLEESFDRYGSLTDKQFKALQKFFERVEG